MKEILYSSIDWLSIKLNGACIALAFITGEGWLKALAAIATISTIVYNSIRIYKEFKQPKIKT
jgi:hypothetical protein